MEYLAAMEPRLTAWSTFLFWAEPCEPAVGRATSLSGTSSTLCRYFRIYLDVSFLLIGESNPKARPFREVTMTSGFLQNRAVMA
jgi:hypothetical protein